MPFREGGEPQNEELSFPELNTLGLQEGELRDLTNTLHELASAQTQDEFSVAISDINDLYNFSSKTNFKEPKSVTISLENSEVTITAVADNKFKIKGKLHKKETE